MKGTMHKKKGFAIILLVIACTVVSAFGVACKKENPNNSSATSTEVSIENFDDQTVQIAYGSDVSMNTYITAEDTNGGVHKGTVTLKNSKGETVELFENRFTALDTEGYTADITVEVDGKTYTKKLTLEVIDASKPQIVMDELLPGNAGQVYTLPEITVTKAYDTTEIIPEVTVSFIGENGNVEMAITDNSFMPEAPGKYLVKVVATDKYGYSSTIEQEVAIKDPNVTSELLVGFDTAESTKHIKLGSYTTVAAEWLETFEGATGVVKAHTSDKYSDYGQSKLAVNTAVSEDDLIGMVKVKDFGYINIRAYFVGEENATYTVRSHNKTIATVPANEWVNIQITKAMIESNSPKSHWMNWGAETALGLDRFALLHKEGGSGDYLFYVDMTSSIEGVAQADRVGVDVYLDSITSEKMKKVVMPEGVLENFDEETSAERFSVKNASGTASAKNTVSWVEKYSDGTTEKNGVLKVELKGDSANTYLYANFTRTVEELKALNISKVSITYCLGADGDCLRLSDASGDTYKDLAKSKTWKTAEISIATLEAYARFKTNGFEETMGSDSTATTNWLIRLVAGQYNTLYIDSIDYTVAE